MNIPTDLTEKNIHSMLDDDVFSFIIKESAASTNTLLKEVAQNDAPEFTVMIADYQTCGRGRLGRSFFSPSGTGIYMSILLKPEKDIEASLLITTCAAVCCARSIEKISGKKAEIKWVNDIYTDNRKVCGILTEAETIPGSTKLKYAVLGIGINVFNPEDGFPDDITNKAGYLFDSKKENPDARSLIIAEILNSFNKFYPKLNKSDFFDEYKERSLLKNREVDVLKPDSVKKATVLDIDEDFRLLVKYADEKIEALSSGDVSLCI